MPTVTPHHEKDTIREEFNAVAPVYESNRLAPWYKAHADEILKVIHANAAGDILDIGCGTGYFLRNYQAQHSGHHAIGVDIAPNMAVVANRSAQDAGIENMTILNEDWEAMNTADIKLAHLNTIVCANAFHYFAEPQAAINKMARLLDKGTVYIMERDKSRSLLTWFWDILHRTIIKDHVVFYDKKAIFSMLEKSGFENIKVEKHLKHYFWKGKLFTNIILISGQKR